MNLFIKQKQKLLQKTNLWLPKGKARGERQIQTLGLADTNFYV